MVRRRRPTPAGDDGLAIVVSTPFGRLAITHVLSVAGDALVAMALAGSLFFDVDPSGARWRIALYLVFTMAPFALVGPLIGPAMDRAKGGHQMILVASAAGRAVLAGAVALAMLAGAVGFLLGGLVGQAMLALLVAIAASSGKQAFDAVVQRDAPGANRGRSFARFESRFQVAWVLGAFIPVVVPMPTRFGSALVALAATAAGALYLAALRALRSGVQPPRLPTVRQISANVVQTVRERRDDPTGDETVGEPDGSVDGRVDRD